MCGYIYIRRHPAYDIENACKLGQTTNIPDRDSLYATGEIRRGYFECVYEVDSHKLIERLLQRRFKLHHIKYDGGTEFYTVDIIPLIEPFFKAHNIPYRVLSREEVEHMIRTVRDKKKCNTQLIETVFAEWKLHSQKHKLSPREYQRQIIDTSRRYYEHHNKGLLVLICGMGKTLISLWITQALQCNSILIGVPNTLLLEQWMTMIEKLYPRIKCLEVSSGVHKRDIREYLRNNRSVIVITTYASSHKVASATSHLEYQFDMKILDEVHHLTTFDVDVAETKKSYVQILNVPSRKQIGLTATLKQIDDTSTVKTISNDDVEHFGDVIERRSLLWAIQNDIVCDYNVQTIIANEEEFESHLTHFNITDDVDKQLFLSAYASLRSINDNHSHHLLIYSNNTHNSQKIIEFINLLLEHRYFVISGLFSSCYNSTQSLSEQSTILNLFSTSTYGIITCVYCLGEGFDSPLIDGVVFAENMTSNIRIVQSALRASRKNKSEPHKKAKIILPVLNIDDWSDSAKESSDMKKVKEVIYQMGVEDETISQKISVYKIAITRRPPKDEIDESADSSESFGEYDEELTQNLRLRTVKRSMMDITYEKAKKIIVEKQIRSKEQYFEQCVKDNRLSTEPDVTYKSKFTNWIDYLSIPREYYTKEECMKKVTEYLSTGEITVDRTDLAAVCVEVCRKDTMFPSPDLWVDYYDVKEISELIKLPRKKKKSLELLY